MAGRTRLPLPSVLDNGLRITDHGLRGLVIETTTAHADAVARHERVMRRLELDATLRPGAKLLLLYPGVDLILSEPSLRAATSAVASTYIDGDDTYVEWPIGKGWLDRRLISTCSADTIARNGGPAVGEADWRAATRFLREIHPEYSHRAVWVSYVADAQAWWWCRVVPPLFAHATRLRPLQLLPRAALARRATGKPQRAGGQEVDARRDHHRLLLQMTRMRSDARVALGDVTTFAGKTARQRGSKDHGRALIVDRIDLALPLAAREGRAQVMVLLGARHAIACGGVRGDLWAPITVYEYLRIGLKRLLARLLECDVDALDGEQWVELYMEVLASPDVRASQRGKFAAFLEAFHRYLVICGADPMPRALAGGGDLLPPIAAVLWPEELDEGLAFVATSGASERIREQATLGLVLGYWVPLRTVELWCIRVGDVHTRIPVFIGLYTRERDGVGKTPSLRRQEDIHDPRLVRLLIDMVNRRRLQDHASDEDVLFGEPGTRDGRHEERATDDLMNAAIRHATGDGVGSYYDLRHAVFSRRAEQVLKGGQDGI